MVARVAGAPVVLLALLRVLPGTAGALVVVALLAAAAAGAARRPVLGALGFTALPFFSLGLAGMHRIGYADPTVRALGFWKEAVAAGLAGAAFVALRRAGTPRLPAVDLVAIGLVLVGLVYAATGFAPIAGPGPDLSTRLAALRTDLGPIALLVIGRHLRLAAEEVRRIHAAVVRAALALVVGAMVELLAPRLWNWAFVDVLQVLRYRVQVLGVDPARVAHFKDDVRIRGEAGGRTFLRLGSLEFDHIAFAFLCVLALAIAAERLVRRAPSAKAALPAVALVVGIVLNQTRAAAVVAGVVLLAATRPLPGRDDRTRWALRRGLLVGGVAVVALAAAVGLLQRFVDDPASNTLHTDNVRAAFDVLVDHPLGLGLGTADGAGQAGFGVRALVPENQYLQIGTQLGWVPMAAYAGVLVTAAVALVRRARAAADDLGTTAAAAAALVALLVAGLTATPLARVSVGWLLAMVAGTALGTIPSRTAADAPEVGTRP